MSKFKHNDKTQLTAHFNVSEFRCKCGRSHNTNLDTDLVQKLEQLYKALNCSKIIVNSGYRCAAHDKAVGGNGYGQHTKGTAADIVCYDKSGKKISSKVVCCAAQDLGFGGIANIDRTYTATHVDVRTSNKWYGDESVPGGTARSVTTDFHVYYGIGKQTTAPTTGTTTITNNAVAPEPARSMDKTLAGTYKVKASALNLRKGAGTNKTILATFPNGTEMQCYGYYTIISGVKWLLVQTTYKGKNYTGFASGDWLVRK